MIGQNITFCPKWIIEELLRFLNKAINLRFVQKNIFLPATTTIPSWLDATVDSRRLQWIYKILEEIVQFWNIKKIAENSQEVDRYFQKILNTKKFLIFPKNPLILNKNPL